MPPYFHVFLSVEPAPEKQRCVFSDLSEAALRASFVRPFKEGKNLPCANEIIPVSNVRRFTITSTDDRSETVLKRFREASNEALDKHNRESSGLVFLGGLGFGPDDLVRMGTDVTAKFISEAPDRVPRPSLINRLFNNSWVVGIAGGVIVAGIAAWLKWN